MDLTELREPFDPAKVHWRLDHVAEQAKRGRALCYLDARDVMDRLDDVCGPENWQTRIEVHGQRVLCSLGIKCGDEWVFKTDGSGDTQFEAEKGGISGAIKRAAVSWGVGRYLYDIEGPWVEVENKSKTNKPRWVIKASEHERLRKLLPGSRIAENGTTPPDPHPEIPDDPSGLDGYMLLGADGRQLGEFTNALGWLGEYEKHIRNAGSGQALKRLRKANQKTRERLASERDEDVLDRATQVGDLINERLAAFEKEPA